mgnify:CR=1 FL=1
MPEFGSWDVFVTLVMITLVVSGIWRPFKAAAMFMEAKARYWNARAALEEHRLKCMKDGQEKGGGA